MPENTKEKQTFENMDLEKVRFDCRFYSGYKPCGKSDGCPDCQEFQPRGKEILIIKLGAMGDVLRTKSILPALKKKYPESWITWLTAPGSESIVKDSAVDEICTFDTEGILSLEGREFDSLYCLDKDKAAIALSKKISAKNKFGYAPSIHNTVGVWNKDAEYALRLGLSDEFKYRMNQKTHQEILAMTCELDYNRDEYTLQVSEESKSKIINKLINAGLDQSKTIIGLNTGCGPVFQTKAWTAEGFIETIHTLAELKDVQIPLLGGKKEHEINQRILNECENIPKDKLIDTGTENSLEDFFAVVDYCDVVLSSDSLAMHIAIALRKHVVAFFGPTCEQEIDLYDRGEKIVTDYSCSPCYLKSCDVDPYCMEAMKAETVLSAIKRQIESVTKGDGVCV